MAYENGNGNGHTNGNGNGHRRNGRRSKLTPETKEIILAALRSGSSRRSAAIRAGVHESSIIVWMDQRPSFSSEVRQAELDAYDEAKVREIITALKVGSTRGAAAGAIGVGPSTFGTWMDLHPDFAASVVEAEAQAKRAHESTLFKAAVAGSWQAALAWLKRRYPDEWGDRVAIDLTAMVAIIGADEGLDDDEKQEAVAAAERYLKTLRGVDRTG